MPDSVDAVAAAKQTSVGAGRYRLISLLKEGGMGVTYRAWDTRQGIPVVVKMPNERSRSDNAAMRRFAREIEATLRLEHDHIVPIVNHGEEDGCPFVVMRFLPGGSLADMRRRDKNGKAQPQVPGTLPLWLPTVASALDFIHGRGLLHRDAKPDNIFFDGFWNAYLGDFGIAKVVDDSGGIPKGETLTGTMATIGTPEYMAPELFQPKTVPDSRSDQYALAVTVYEMLAGEKPFTGTVAHIVVEQSTLPVPPLASRAQGLPDSLCAAVEKALAKRPEDRFKTCGEFVSAALRDLLPSPREPNMARLLCPSCSTILRMPTAAGGKSGKCPNCRAEMRIAEDLSALWLSGEEDGILATPSRQPFEAVAFEPTACVPQALVDDQAATPPVELIPPRRRLAWIIAPMLAAVALSMIAGVASHVSWKNHHERQIAALTAEQIARSQAAEAEWQKKVAAAEERLAVGAKTSSESESLVKELRDEVAQLGMMLDESEAVAKRLSEKNELAKVVTDATSLEMLSRESGEMVEEVAVAEGEADGEDGMAQNTDIGHEPPSLPQKTLTVEEAEKAIISPVRRARNQRRQLQLNDLTDLSPDVAAVLAKPSADLSLDGLATLYPEAASALAKHKGKSLSLNGLTAISSEVAEALATHNGERLSLNGLTILSPQEAKSLGTRWRQYLSLDGLPTISAQASEAISRCEHLSLNGLDSLSPEVAKAVGRLGASISLNGLTTLSPEAARGLAGCVSLSLNGLTTLTPEAAKSLAKCQILSLDGLVDLSQEVAEPLMTNRIGHLKLNGLIALSAEVAKELAEQVGWLYLNGVTTLSDEAASELSQSKAFCRLDGLTKLSDHAAAELHKNKRVQLPYKFRAH